MLGGSSCWVVAVTRPGFTQDFHPIKLLLACHNFILFTINIIYNTVLTYPLKNNSFSLVKTVP